nr:hypothetical protein [Tanacetum cinerariifolium]
MRVALSYSLNLRRLEARKMKFLLFKTSSVSCDVVRSRVKKVRVAVAEGSVMKAMKSYPRILLAAWSGLWPVVHKMVGGLFCGCFDSISPDVATMLSFADASPGEKALFDETRILAGRSRDGSHGGFLVPLPYSQA